MELNTIKEWYANRTNKAVTDFDEVDLFVCKVAYDFTIEQVKKCSVLDAVIVCDNCTELNRKTCFLGVTCPKCNKPFRSIRS